MTKYNKGITFGAFDPLHYGHIKLFMRCKEQCNFLIVAVSDGEYIAKHKNRDEYVPFDERVKVIEMLPLVNLTTKQSEVIGKKQLVAIHKPDVIFVGDDWTPGTFTGEGLGVPVVYLPYTKVINSTELRERGI